MTQPEYQTLIDRLGTEERVKRCIEILDNYKGSSGKKYHSDYRAILTWVIDRLLDEEQRHGVKSRPEIKPEFENLANNPAEYDPIIDDDEAFEEWRRQSGY